MRSSKSRSRGNKNNRNRNSVGNIVNRVFDSSGPEGKVRGTPQQIIEKYNQLTRDAQLSNDRVAAENFAQHAEHYTRLLAAGQREADARRDQQEAQNRERQAQRDAERAQRDAERAERNAQRNDQQRGDQPRTDQPRADQPRTEQPRAEKRDQPVAAEGVQDLADAPQPDLLETAAPAEETGLVDTPESKPKKPRNRKPRAPRKLAAEKTTEAPTEAPAAVEAPAAAPVETAETVPDAE